MSLQSESSRHPLGAAALLAMLCIAMAVRAESPVPNTSVPVTAQFRGCESAGWCRFWVESADPLAQSLRRVYPDGVPETDGNEELAIVMRNRLNALMSSFVHQHKRILLYNLRELGDATWAANITVNEADLAADPTLAGLLREFAARNR